MHIFSYYFFFFEVKYEIQHYATSFNIYWQYISLNSACARVKYIDASFNTLFALLISYFCDKCNFQGRFSKLAIFSEKKKIIITNITLQQVKTRNVLINSLIKKNK